jgi:uncharacterized membrane protein
MVVTDLVIARALHVLAVVIWIGGVSMATTVVLPAVRRGEFGEARLQAFQAVKRRFAWQVRTALIVVGLSGLYMIWRLDLWDRFQTLAFWWMHAMVCLWFLFAIVLLVGERFILHRPCRRGAATHSQAMFARLHRVHGFLLVLSVITILGAVAGSQGWGMF